MNIVGRVRRTFAQKILRGGATRRRITASVAVAALAVGLAPAAASGAIKPAAVAADGDSPLSLTLSQQTGTEPFQGDDAPGNDSGPENDIVRTNDTVTYNLGIRYQGEDQTNPTVTFTLPRGQELVSLPPFCLEGSSVVPESLPDPAVPLTATSWEELPEQAVTCVLKDEVAGTSLNYPFSTKVRSEVPNGTVMDPVTFRAASDQVVDGVTTDPVTQTVSAAARFDLSKRGFAEEANQGPLRQGTGPCQASDSTKTCRYMWYAGTISVPAGGKGTAPLSSPITFEDNLDPSSFYGAEAWAQMVGAAGSVDAAKAAYAPAFVSCSPIGQSSGLNGSVPYSAIGQGSYADASNAVRDTGTMDCPTQAPGENGRITLTDTDTSAATTPTQTGSGAALPAAPALVASFEFTVEVPMDAILEFGGVEENGTYTLETHNEFTNISMNGIDGSKNSGENPDNNSRDAMIRLQANGSFDKLFSGVFGQEGNTSAQEFATSRRVLEGPPGSGVAKDGNTVVMVGQSVQSNLSMTASGPAGSGTASSQTFVTCDVWDPSRLALASEPSWHGWDEARYPSNGEPAYVVNYREGWTDRPSNDIGSASSSVQNFVIEYSSGPAGAGEDADCSSGAWAADPAGVPGASSRVDAEGRTVWAGINRVRVTFNTAWPSEATFDGLNLAVGIGQVVLDSDSSDPIGNWASQMVSSGVRTTAEVIADPNRENRLSAYDPVTHAGAYGDRLIQGEAIARVKKYVENPTTGEFEDTAVPQYTSGASVRYRLDPSLTTSVAVGGSSSTLVIEDCLPRHQIFTSSVQGDTELMPELVQMGAPDGSELSCGEERQFIRWNLGEVSIGASIEPIIVTAEILDVARNGVYTNDVLVSSPADRSAADVRSDDVQMQLVVPTGIKIAKTVDKPVIEVNPVEVSTPRTMTWSVQFANVDAPTNVENVDVIDVLPAVGQNGNEFTGSLVFDSVQVVTGEEITILYTKTSAANLISEPSDASNAADGSTVWCDAVSGGVVYGNGAAADCPQTDDEVTGLRFLRPGPFTPDDEFQVDITMVPVGNAGGDVYRNIASGRADGVTQGVGPAARVVEVVASSVGDRVWSDDNANGIQDDGETGVAGVLVRLVGVDVDGNPVDLTTTTDADGNYLFTGLASGSYRITFDVTGLMGYSFTQKGAGEDPERDSNADPSTGVSDEFALGVGVEDLSIDAGLVRHFGTLVINKQLVGAGVKDFAAQDQLTFGVVCAIGGTSVFAQDVTLAVAGQTSVSSENVGPIPAGAECTVTETGAGNADADALPEPVTVTIPWNPETTEQEPVIASLTNFYSAGSVEASKALVGDDLAVAAAEDTVFDVLITCQIEETNGQGALVRSDLYSGVVKLKGGQTKYLVDEEGNPRKLPLGTRCFGEETNTGGAAKSTVDFDSWENAAVVSGGSPEELQILTIAAVNTFENAALTVSKKVVGPGTGGSYDFSLVCTMPGVDDKGNAVETRYELPKVDAEFSLKDGEERTVSVPAGATCQAVEINVPQGAKVTVADSDETTRGGESDGIVAKLAGAENTVKVTNTFAKTPDEPDNPDKPVVPVVPNEPDDPQDPVVPVDPPSLAITGGQLSLGIILLGVGLLLVGGGFFVLRRRQSEKNEESAPVR